MPLTYTQSVDTLTGRNFLATGSNGGERIVVDVSVEVLQDKGEPAALRMGSMKYDAGNVESDKITVRTTDFP